MYTASCNTRLTTGAFVLVASPDFGLIGVDGRSGLSGAPFVPTCARSIIQRNGDGPTATPEPSSDGGLVSAMSLTASKLFPRFCGLLVRSVRLVTTGSKR